MTALADHWWQILVIVAAVALALVAVIVAVAKNKVRTSIGKTGLDLQPAADARRDGNAAGPETLPSDAATPATVGNMGRVILRIAQEMSAPTSSADDVAKHETALLMALRKHARQGREMERRASILIVKRTEDRGIAMVLRRYNPTEIFDGKSMFLYTEWLEHKQGMCWKAAVEAVKARKANKFAPTVYTVPDVAAEKSFADTESQYKFKSILIAPIVAAGSILGAVCLDADRPYFYTEADELLVELVAETLATLWLATGEVDEPLSPSLVSGFGWLPWGR